MTAVLYVLSGLTLALSVPVGLIVGRWLWRALDRSEWTPADQTAYERAVAEQRGQR